MSKGKQFIKRLHAMGGVHDKETQELFKPEPLPEQPEMSLKYYPETATEIYYFQKYAMLLALAHSQLKYTKELNDYIDYLEKKIPNSNVSLVK